MENVVSGLGLWNVLSTILQIQIQPNSITFTTEYEIAHLLSGVSLEYNLIL